MFRARAAAVLMLLAAPWGAACGGGDGPEGETGAPTTPPVLGQHDAADPAEPPALGFPESATKNTTRIAGADPVADAAGAALAAHPSTSPETRPAAVTLVDRADWATAISASQLAGSRVGAPVLFSDGQTLPPVTAAALARLAPTGAEGAGGAQVIRVGTAARAAGLRETNLEGADAPALARAVDRLHIAAAGEPSRFVLVAALEDPAYAMPAAGWAAKSGDPVLWSRRDELPADTIAAIRAHGRPRIYVLGPRAAISERVVERLEGLGQVRRVGAADPVRNAIAFARYADEGFGWGVTDPGHGLVVATAQRPADAAAAAPLSAAGSYGPLLLVDAGADLPEPLRGFLLDIQPGYERDPVRGVYNHAWLIGDATTISVEVQSRIDALLEIQPVDTSP